MNSHITDRLAHNLVLLMVSFCVALLGMGGCSEQSTPQNMAAESAAPQKVAPQSAPSPAPQPEAKTDAAGGCKNFPHEIFHIGARIEINDFSKLVDTDCPKAKSYPDGRLEVTHLGSRYVVRTTRVEISGTEYFEIQSVKLSEGQAQ